MLRFVLLLVLSVSSIWALSLSPLLSPTHPISYDRHEKHCSVSTTTLLTSDNVTLFVFIYTPRFHNENSGQGVLLAGIGGGRTAALAACLADFLCDDGYLVVTYDWRGAGNSDKGNSLNYTWQRLALDAAEVASGFLPSNPILIGDSVAGMIGIAWTSGYIPGLPPLSKFVGIGASARPFNLLFGSPILPNIGLTPETLLALETENATLLFELTLNDQCEADRHYNELVQDILEQVVNPISIIVGYESQLTYDATPYLHNISIPTLFIQGNTDAHLDFHSTVYLYNNVPGAQLAGNPNRGHTSALTDNPGTLEDD